jgi:hypothetical protein
MFNAVYINFAECYGPEGSLPLREALEALLGTEDVSTYRNDGFATVHCPVTDESYFLYDGCAVTRGPDGRIIVLEDMEPFRREVSDAAKEYNEAASPMGWEGFDRFIIPADEPDALVDVWGDLFVKNYNLDQFCAALEARGLEIRAKDAK